MKTCFKRSHAYTATLNTPNPAAGHHQPTPLLETPEHPWANLGQSLLGSLLLSPGSCCTQHSVCALQVSVSQSRINSGSSMVGLVATSSKSPYAIPRSTTPRAHVPATVTADLYLHRRHSNMLLPQSLWGSLGPDFAPPTILLGLLFPWAWGIASHLLQCHANQKRYAFHCRGLECKSRKPRNTSTKRQIWPWSTE